MDRYYRGHCDHGLFVAILSGRAAQADSFLQACPAGCVVELTTRETAPPADDPG